jgi:type IV pilus assembly protein PilX
MGMLLMSNDRSFPSCAVRPRAQKGAALVTSLLLLLVLTIIGITAMQMTRMQERMAGNTRDLNLAFQGAEAALRNGEALIGAQPNKPDECNVLPCEFWQAGASLVANPAAGNDPWWDMYANEYEASGDRATLTHEMTELKADPRFVVQYITRVPDTLTVGEGGGAPPGRDFYQVTGRSIGGSGKANTVLQSTFARR